MNKLFNEVVVATRLSSLFAERMVERACLRVAIDPAKLQHADLAKLIPELEVVVRGFLKPEECELAKASLNEIARRPASRYD